MLPQIDFKTYPSQIFWALIAFAILYFMVSKFIIPKFEEIVNFRQNKIKDDINSSDQIFKKVSDLKKEYDMILKNTYNEAGQIRKNKLEEFNKVTLNTKQNFKQSVDELINNNLSNLEINLKEFESSQHDAILNLSSFMLEKIIMIKPDTEILKSIIKKL